jgi:hypothetical protein
MQFLLGSVRDFLVIYSRLGSFAGRLPVAQDEAVYEGLTLKGIVFLV